MGKLIVIDGTDGSGKETQIKILENKLKERNIDFRKVDFPNYDSPSSSLVKMYLSGDFGTDAKSISPYVASTFYAADRFATYKTEFEEYYENGGLILADRYTTANMVHQAGKIKDKEERKKFLDWLWDLEFNIYKIPVPDKIFFLNMPIDVVEKLIKNRGNKFDKNAKKDIHESNEKHLIESYEAACELAKDYRWDEIRCVKERKTQNKRRYRRRDI
ncbi:MAG: deoxynucleoside kinase [Clostridia bacterium]|nr:deoxynucleoside kinase [Clostridia bacterium]MCI9275379.1 deoxynucleoside kinase [Clostridia bacterium]